MHRLLKRQINRYIGNLEEIPNGWQKLIKAIGNAYEQADTERHMLERTIELNSQELLELNSQIRAAIPDTFLRLDKQGTILDNKPSQNAHAYLPATQVLGKQIYSFLPEAACQTMKAAIDSLDHQKLPEVSIVHTLIDEGKTYFYEVRLLPLLDHQVVAIIRDITERKQTEAALQQSQRQLEEKTHKLATALTELKKTQAQLVQNEKMSGLGQLVAGIAHEINNPVNFVSGNLFYVNSYTNKLIDLLMLYQAHYPEPVETIQTKIEEVDLVFLMKDIKKVEDSMQLGVDRIGNIVKSLRTFSRLDEAEMKKINIHEGIESTLLILNHRLKERKQSPEILVQKHYGDLPPIECYASQLNQVFMNIIANAIDALRETENLPNQPLPTIAIYTQVMPNGHVLIRITNNGPTIPKAIHDKLFDPFFTTKPVGDGTGLGLSISYQIVVDKHGGKLKCLSSAGQDTEFWIEIPPQQSSRNQKDH